MHSSTLLALAASVSTAFAVSQGFNYGAVNSDGSNRYQADFEREFKLAKELPGTSGFTSARLYTMIQAGSSTNEPIQAIPAAIAQDTTLLLGLWASAGDGFFGAEITALQSAIAKWGSAFTDRVVGISVGSEDLYRISPTGIAAKSGYGADPATIARYITQLRSAISGTALARAPVGHVDTWTAWVNGSNKAVVDAVDWVGVDAYPYFQNTQTNSIANGKSLFESALADTQAAAGGKELWITETGWPVSGPTENLASANPQDAKAYWDAVGCPRFGKVNTWWYTLQDATPTIPSPSFGIVGPDGKPIFDLSCKAPTSSSSSAAASSSTSSASSAAPSSTTGNAAGSSPSSSASSAAASSAAASVSSVASSIASSPPVSSGGGLSPSQGGGIVVSSSASQTAAGPFPTSGNLSVVVGQPTTGLTTQTTIVTGTGTRAATPAASSTGPAIVNGNGAATLSGSFVGALVAVFAVALAL